MSDLVNPDVECDVVDKIKLGDDKASSQISFQLAQDFYNEITGKAENIKDYSRESFILKLHHIEQLHHLLEQSLEQYNIQSFNENYSVNYVDDCSERFSSLAKLKLQVTSRGAAIEDINIQYNIFIVLPKTHRAQEYKINVFLVSRVAKMERAREEISGMPFEIPLFQFEKNKIAVFSIDYIDISVANALMSVIKNWFNNIEKHQLSPTIKKARKFSQFLPRLFKYGFLALSSYFIFLAAETYVTSESNLHTAVVFLLCASLTMFSSYRIGKYFGRKAEINLDSIYEQSYISFSGSDENYVAKSTTKIASSRNKVIKSIIVTLILGVCGSLVASGIIS